MKTTTRTAAKHYATDDYLALIMQFPLRRIHNDQENNQALKISGDLLFKSTTGKLTHGEDAYLGALELLICDYESVRFATLIESKTSPLQKLQFLVTESHTTQTQFAEIVGIKQSAASLILNGKRALTSEAIRKLATHFKLDASYFL
jgi:antitoxin component HigA of HigAB toxin-antitoxin module